MLKEENKLISTKNNISLNSLEIRIINLAISQLNPLKSLKQNREFEFTIKELLGVNFDVKNYAEIYNAIQNAILRLSNLWVRKDSLDGYGYSEFRLITGRSYLKGEARFIIEFHEKAIPYLVEIKNNYTSILLSDKLKKI